MSSCRVTSQWRSKELERSLKFRRKKKWRASNWYWNHKTLLFVSSPALYNNNSIIIFQIGNTTKRH